MIRSIKKPKTNITTVAVWSPETEIRSLMYEFERGMKTIFPHFATLPKMLKADYYTNIHEPVKKLIFLFDSEFEPYKLSVKEREAIPHPKIFMADFNELAKYVDQEAPHLKNKTERTEIFIPNRVPSAEDFLDLSKYYKPDGNLNMKDILNETLKHISNYSID